MEKGEILQKLRGDRRFLFRFLIDNQPEALMSRVRELGWDSVNTEERLHDFFVRLNQRRPGTLARILSKFDYDQTRDNYTGGFEEREIIEALGVDPDQKKQEQQGPTVQGWKKWAGAVGDAVSDVLGPNDEDGSVDQSEEIRKEIEEAKEEAQAAKQRAIWTLVGALGLVTIVVLVMMNRRTAKK